MNIHRFYLPPSSCTGNEWTLPEDESHHAISVLRIKASETVVVLNGQGSEWRCEVAAVEKGAVRIRPKFKNDHPPFAYRMTLIQAVTKGKTMDLIVQKAAELGAHAVIPVLSDRSVPDWTAEAGAEKAAKWRQIAIEAIKQCGSPWLPEIANPTSVQALLQKQERYELQMVASLQPDARHPRTALETTRAEKGRNPKSLACWIGPEGDFTPAEINAVRSAGALPITLGPLVLRSETAAIYCMSVLNYELQAAATAR